MHGWIVRWVCVPISCFKAQHAWMVGTLGILTIVLLSITRRWRTVSSAEWVEARRVRVGSRRQACYGNEHSAWRNSAIRHIPTDGKVSGFFRHVKGDNEGIEKYLKERRE